MDPLTVLMHELGHLLGYGHSEDEHDLMAPVLSPGWSSAEAVEPLGQAEWRTGLECRRASDDVFAELGRDELTKEDRRKDSMSQLRVPRRSRVQRYEREADAWFADLATDAVGRQIACHSVADDR